MPEPLEPPTTGSPADPVTQDDEEHQDDELPEQDNYPADVVKSLRDKNYKYRNRAKDAEARAETAEKLADERARALFLAKVAATGKLASAEDLPYSADLLDDDEALTAAIDELVTKRPHYAARKPVGSIGQGITGKQEQPFSMMGKLQHRV